MSEIREKYSPGDLRIMTLHLYRMVMSTNEEEQEMARQAKGNQIWKVLFEEQQRVRSLARCDHSVQSMNARYRRLLAYALHKVEGVAPEQVLRCYKFCGTKLKAAQEHEVKVKYRKEFTCTFVDGVLRSYKRIGGAPASPARGRRAVIVDEEEDEENEDGDGMDVDSRDGIQMRTDEEREDDMNVTPPMRTPGGTRRGRVDVDDTPLSHYGRRLAAFPHDPVVLPASDRRVRAPSPGTMAAARAAGAFARAARQAADAGDAQPPSPPSFTPPLSRATRNNKRAQTAAAAASPAPPAAKRRDRDASGRLSSDQSGAAATAAAAARQKRDKSDGRRDEEEGETTQRRSDRKKKERDAAAAAQQQQQHSQARRKLVMEEQSRSTARNSASSSSCMDESVMVVEEERVTSSSERRKADAASSSSRMDESVMVVEEEPVTTRSSERRKADAARTTALQQQQRRLEEEEESNDISMLILDEEDVEMEREGEEDRRGRKRREKEEATASAAAKREKLQQVVAQQKEKEREAAAAKQKAEREKKEKEKDDKAALTATRDKVQQVVLQKKAKEEKEKDKAAAEAAKQKEKEREGGALNGHDEQQNKKNSKRNERAEFQSGLEDRSMMNDAFISDADLGLELLDESEESAHESDESESDGDTTVIVNPAASTTDVTVAAAAGATTGAAANAATATGAAAAANDSSSPTLRRAARRQVLFRDGSPDRREFSVPPVEEQLRELLLLEQERSVEEVAREMAVLLGVGLSESRLLEVVRMIRAADPRAADEARSSDEDEEEIVMEQPERFVPAEMRLDTSAETLATMLDTFNTAAFVEKMAERACDMAAEMMERSGIVLTAQDDEKIVDHVMSSLENTLEEVLLDDTVFESNLID